MMRAAAFALAMLVCSVASATAARVVSLDQLSRRAELIVEADAAAEQSFRIDGRIFTRTVMRVRSAWKGMPAPEISVVTRGGIVDGIGQRVDGEAVLPSGAHAVLFLVYDERLEGYRTLALAQGAYVIADTPRTGAPPGLSPTQARLQPRDLESFERQVRDYAR